MQFTVKITRRLLQTYGVAPGRIYIPSYLSIYQSINIIHRQNHAYTYLSIYK